MLVSVVQHMFEDASLCIKMLDKFEPDRRYVSVMELHGFEWKLAELRIIGGAAKASGTRVARDLIGVQ